MQNFKQLIHLINGLWSELNKHLHIPVYDSNKLIASLHIKSL